MIPNVLQFEYFGEQLEISERRAKSTPNVRTEFGQGSTE